ncbi:MAG: hypothetical protein H9W81_05815 [Enterococcus sp.]|nr:hypothetical protein [Enterococcus sp.]
MTVHNYYLVSRETKKVHFLLKVDPYFMSKNEQPEAWLAGRLYFSNPTCGITLPELYALDYLDPYGVSCRACSDTVFEYLGEINYASYKGYRIYNFPHTIQHYDDFAGNDIMEMNAFLATLFKQYIGSEEIKRWGEENFADKYGVNELIMEHFSIEYDNDESIHLHPDLRDDIEWNGFPTRN